MAPRGTEPHLGDTRHDHLPGTCCAMGRAAGWGLDVTSRAHRGHLVDQGAECWACSPQGRGHTCRTHPITQAPGHRPRVCLAPRVPLPSRPFQGPQSSPALQGRGVGTGSRVHTLTGLQGDSWIPTSRWRWPCPLPPGARVWAEPPAGSVRAMLPMATRGQQRPTYCYSVAQSCPTLIPWTAVHQASLSITNSRS